MPKYIKAVPGKGIVASTEIKGSSAKTLAESLQSAPRIEVVRLHDVGGRILGKLDKDVAIQQYGQCSVTGWYTSSKTEADVWIQNAVDSAESVDEDDEFPYIVDDTAKDLYQKARDNLDTDIGYQAYYELEKHIVDNHLDDSILYDLAADFAWDDRLNEALDQLAADEGRYDLVTV